MSSSPGINGPGQEITISSDINQASGRCRPFLPPPPPSFTTTTLVYHHPRLPPPSFVTTITTTLPITITTALSASTAFTAVTVVATSTLQRSLVTCAIHLPPPPPPLPSTIPQARRCRYRHPPRLGRHHCSHQPTGTRFPQSDRASAHAIPPTTSINQAQATPLTASIIHEYMPIST
ncbi:hypothetical protein CPC08DRAFT_769213 [Agrocybe pediades]|nr:hypothetical protein CPC08DRAFT_769213 [Agrocybe pediades]